MLSTLLIWVPRRIGLWWMPRTFMAGWSSPGGPRPPKDTNGLVHTRLPPGYPSHELIRSDALLWQGAAPSPPVSAGCRRFLKELFGPNCGDEHLIAYFDKSAQLAMRAKATYIGSRETGRTHGN